MSSEGIFNLLAIKNNNENKRYNGKSFQSFNHNFKIRKDHPRKVIHIIDHFILSIDMVGSDKRHVKFLFIQ